MDEYLLELGLSDIKVKLAGHEDYLEPEALRTLLTLILEVECLSPELREKGSIPRISPFQKCRRQIAPFPRQFSERRDLCLFTRGSEGAENSGRGAATSGS